MWQSCFPPAFGLKPKPGPLFLPLTHVRRLTNQVRVMTTICQLLLLFAFCTVLNNAFSTTAAFKSFRCQVFKENHSVSQPFFSVSQAVKIPVWLHVHAQNEAASNLLKYPYKELKHPVLLPKLRFLVWPNIPGISKLLCRAQQRWCYTTHSIIKPPCSEILWNGVTSYL